jgi:hypothetical protein
MSRVIDILVWGGVIFLAISIAALRTRSLAQSDWADKLVLPPRWLAPAFGLVPSVQTDPRAVPRGTVYWYWFSIAWIGCVLLFSRFTQDVTEFTFALAVVPTGIGWILASVIGRYWPYKGP